MIGMILVSLVAFAVIVGILVMFWGDIYGDGDVTAPVPLSGDEGPPRDAQGRTAYDIIRDSNHAAMLLRSGAKDRSREPLLGPPADMTVSRVILSERPDETPETADLLAVKINDALAHSHPVQDAEGMREKIAKEVENAMAAYLKYHMAKGDGRGPGQIAWETADAILAALPAVGGGNE